MSGHSKWSSTKHKKAVIDARRGKLFAKLIRGIEVAAREGGGNPDGNPTLVDAIGRARDASVPNDTIERAIKRGTGELDGIRYETLIYEGYAPGGVAVMLEVKTDNRNRAAADVRRAFTKNGGALGGPGSVGWMFTKRGILQVPAKGVSEDELLTVASDAGADDLRLDGDSWEVTCDPTRVHQVRKAIEEAGIAVDSAQVTMLPNSTVKLDLETARRVLRCMDDLEDADDVQEVYANFDIPDEVFQEVYG